MEDSGSAENKEILLFSHDKLSLASILRPLHQHMSCENNNISLFSALPESSNMYSNKDSNLISDLRDKYGENSVSLFRKWENTTKKMTDYRNHRRFMLKCIKASITPVSCKIKSPPLLDLTEVIKSSTRLKNNSYINVLET